MCLCARSSCTAPLLAGVCGVCVCAWARVSATARHFWLGCWGVCVFLCPLRLYPATHGSGVWCGCVFGLGFRLRPATPGWAVGVWVCLFGCSACTSPLLAGVCGVGVCACPGVSAAPRHSCLGCWGVCVFVCARRLYPATPDWGVWCVCVCLGSGFGCGPPLLAGILGCVCVCVPAPLLPHDSWPGCAVWVCVLGLGFRLRPATPGWGVELSVCSCTRSARTPPLPAGVCRVGVLAWARFSAAPRHSWLGGWGVCVFVCALRLYPVTPGWGVRLGCVCLGWGVGCAPPLLTRVLGCVCVFVRALLVPRHSWLGCVAWLCVLGLGFRLRPATPGWAVGVCVCLCARSACTPPLLARLCGMGVCAWAWVSAAPHHSWPGYWGVCVFVCTLRLYPATPGWGVRCDVCAWVRVSAAPRHSWLGCWGVCVFVCALYSYPATPGRVCGVWVGCCLGPVPLLWFVACCARCPGLRHPVTVVA